ncbi:hypothetical protein EYZ11_009017 [Aspergillus tanneri]|uniref:protein-histidine N-methyltransferase n=1 Tax=Aspergillus tanneri TaxID=1220188 RepID=A0A4S3JEH5_9EURO|nr:hypothetical protein EYZ11_009017 [Aspergillus tanneri]
MASTFSFGFSGDDIDIDESEFNSTENVSLPQGNDDALPSLVGARKHDMKDWTSSLPSQIAYNLLELNGLENQAAGTVPEVPPIARREVFDVRTQLMAEDTADHENEELIAGLEKGDIKPQFYEGGFKTWECALDLAKSAVSEDELFCNDENQTGVQHILELGAGTAVPSLALFAQLISQENPESQRKYHFTFADYNSEVLRLVTLPNLLLTWNYVVTRQHVLSTNSSPEHQAQDEELDITPELVDNFEKDLVRRGITVEFISGAWSPTFVDLVLSSPGRISTKTLILASETIYSPASLCAFSETLSTLLRAAEGSGQRRALIAAKKVYFGVGGGVDEFLAVLEKVSRGSMDVKEKLNINSEGVGRVILEITARSSQQQDQQH